MIKKIIDLILSLLSARINNSASAESGGNKKKHEDAQPMTVPIKRLSEAQVITSPFGMRTLNGQRRMHRGIDLRSRRFSKEKGYVPQWGLQDVVFSEDSAVLRWGTDPKGNDFLVVKPLENMEYSEIKYIHVTVDDKIKQKGIKFLKGDKIGKTQVKGSSTVHHLHFETWKDGKPVDPVEYLDKIGVKYQFK